MATLRKQKGVLERDDKDKIVMSLKNLVTLCEQDGLYEYPEMNSKIYLHFKGFNMIENLDPFVNLKTLYLENNLIAKIQGLEKLTQLTHLFLQHNIIKSIEGLEQNTLLVNVNLSNNLITRIENLTHLTRLENLSIASNQLTDFDSLSELSSLPALSCCGLEDNRIGYDERIFEEIFKRMPAIRVLYLQGNDFGREFPYYRKRMIGSLPELTYLDDRPVFPDERVLSEAYVAGGKERMNAVLKETAEKKQEQKREEQAANQKKSLEIKANRIVFFEKNLKKGLIEIEMLKKKLNRARLIGDVYMISQLEEVLNKESNMANDVEETLVMMRKGLSQMIAAQQAQQSSAISNGSEADGQDEQKRKAGNESSQFAKDDIEKLLSAVLHSVTKEEEFTVESITEALEEMVLDILAKTSPEGTKKGEARTKGQERSEFEVAVLENVWSLVDAGRALEVFKANNPNYIENLKIIEHNEFIKRRTINNDPHSHVDEGVQELPIEDTTDASSCSNTNNNPDYLDELE